MVILCKLLSVRSPHLPTDSLEPRPGLLLYHFLWVNLYTAYYLLKSAPWYAKPLALLDGPLVFIRSSLMFFSLWFAESKAVKN